MFPNLKILDGLVDFTNSPWRKVNELYKFPKDSRKGEFYITKYGYFIRICVLRFYCEVDLASNDEWWYLI